ncbi:MAG: hypothetical protein FJY73_04560 [Candidatus Eisenbacteria bacterium]|nr:hypothetical protein [Candidatus Eisenbacteria bacterium]
MRWLGIGLVVGASLTGCASSRPGATGSPEAIIESWETVDVGPMNERIDAAVSEGAEWPKSPLSATVQLLGGDVDTRILSLFEEKNRGEGADTTVVVIVRDGFLDDSVRGDWHRIVYARGADGMWRVAKTSRAFRCWRGHHLETFSSQWCP